MIEVVDYTLLPGESQRAAARRLGIALSTLQQRLKSYGRPKVGHGSRRHIGKPKPIYSYDRDAEEDGASYQYGSSSILGQCQSDPFLMFRGNGWVSHRESVE